MRKLWLIRSQINKTVEETNTLTWSTLDPDDLEDVSKKMQKMLRGLPRSVRKNPAFKGLNGAVKDFANTVPLIAILLHSSMRQRHWDITKKIVGKDFTLPDDDPTTTGK